MESKNKNTFVGGAAILGIAGLICKIIGAFFRIPLRNMMGVAGMTYYSTVYPYYSALLTVSSAGLPTAISKLVAEKISLGDREGAKHVFKKALVLLTCIGIATTALMFFGADALARATNCPGSEKSFRALAPALFLVSVMCAYRGYLQGLQQMTGTALSQLAEQIGKLVFSLLLVRMWLPYGFDIAAMGALLGITASEALGLLVIFLFYLRNKLHEPQLRTVGTAEYSEGKKDNTIRKILAIAVPVTIGASIMPFTGIVDTLLIKNIMLNTGFTREYADMCFAVFRTDVSTVINMPAVLTIALAMSLVPAISSARALRDEAKVKSVSVMGLKLAFIIGLPCAVGLYVVGGEVIDFLFAVSREELAIGRMLMQTSSVGIMFLALVQTMTGCIQGCGKPVIPVINLAIGAVVKIVLMTVLIANPALNINGAAISTVACYAVAGILDMLYLIRFAKIHLNVFDVVIKPVIAAGTMGIMVYCLTLLLTGRVSNTVVTLVSVALGAVAYLLMIVLLKAFSREELLFIPGGAKLSGLFYRRSGK